MSDETTGEESNLSMALKDLWPEPYELDSSLSPSARSEFPFMDAAVELTKEFGTIAHLLAGLRSAEPPDRNGAVLRGMAVRIAKLTLRLVAETCEHRGEFQLVAVFA